MLYEAAQSMMHSKKMVLAQDVGHADCQACGMKKAIVALAHRLAVINAPHLG